MIVANPIKGLGTVGLLAAGGILLGAASWYGSTVNPSKPTTVQDVGTTISETASYYNTKRKQIDAADTLLEKANGDLKALTDSEVTQLQDNLNAISEEFGLAAVDLAAASQGIVEASNLISQANAILRSEVQYRINTMNYEADEAIRTGVSEKFVSKSDAGILFDKVFTARSENEQGNNVVEMQTKDFLTNSSFLWFDYDTLSESDRLEHRTTYNGLRA